LFTALRIFLAPDFGHYCQDSVAFGLHLRMLLSRVPFIQRQGADSGSRCWCRPAGLGVLPTQEFFFVAAEICLPCLDFCPNLV
jgi:hypothetical protein